jgi:hypothetical protein
MTTEAGWYPDPDDPHTTRYWDGIAWAAQRRWDGTAWVQVDVRPSGERLAPVATTSAGSTPETGLVAGIYRLPADQRKLMVLGGAIAGVLLLVVVGFLATSVFGGGGGSSVGAFCSDRKGHELAASDVSGLSTNSDRWSSSQKASVKEVGDAFRAAAGDAPAKIKPDIEKLVTIWERLEHGGGISRRDRTTFSTSTDRVETYIDAECPSS